MTTIQDIYVWSDGGIRIDISLEKVNNQFSVEVSKQIGGYDPIFKSSICHKFYASPKTAFEDAIKYANDFINKKNDKIAKIDNPCNVVFIDKLSEEDVLKALTLPITILVNGK